MANPFAAPSDAKPPAEELRPLTLSAALLFVLKSGFVFAAIGAILGLLIGLGVPQYYRHVFNAEGDDSFFPPVAGILLGFAQGGTLGAFVGLGLVAIHGWLQLLRGRDKAKQS